jgi:hypothetical protein
LVSSFKIYVFNYINLVKFIKNSGKLDTRQSRTITNNLSIIVYFRDRVGLKIEIIKLIKVKSIFIFNWILKNRKMSLKSITKSNILLYRLWILIDNGKRKLPENNDNWYFDGYPRSGNTFSKGLFLNIHPELNGTSHLHCIAGLKIALKKKIRTVIIFRDPLQSILSNAYTKSNRDKNYQKYSKVMLEELVAEWISYYDFSIKNDKSILFIEFKPNMASMLINIKKIKLHLGLNAVQDDKLQDNVSSYQELMKNKEGRKEAAYSSLPKKERTDFKNKIKGDLLSLILYERAADLYLKMQELSTKAL